MSQRLIRVAAACMISAGSLAANGHHLSAQEGVDSAPPMTLPNSHVHDFRSGINGRPYRLIVKLPQGYATNRTVRYPVLYMVDGGIAVPTAAIAYQVNNGGTDSLIFVGIAYSDAQAMRYRMIDYANAPVLGADSATRKRSADGTCCQAPITARVLREEIIPFIDRSYRTTDDRGILGHSIGAIFAAYLLFAEPDLFRRYGITTPSPWTQNAALFEQEEKYSRTHTALPKRVFISVGSEEFLYNRYTADRLTATLLARHYDALELTSMTLVGAQHGSMVEYSYALRVLYPPRAYIETSGNAAVKDSALRVVRRFVAAYSRGDTVDIRKQLVMDSTFRALLDGKIVDGVDRYLSMIRAAAMSGSDPLRIDTLYAASDHPKNSLFIAAYAKAPKSKSRASRPRLGVLTFEVVRQPKGWRIAYVLDVPRQSTKPVTVVRVNSGGGPVGGAEVSVESDAGQVVKARTDASGVARIDFDWHLDWTKPSYLLVKAAGFQPEYAPPPNRDSVTVTLKTSSVKKPQ